MHIWKHLCDCRIRSNINENQNYVYCNYACCSRETRALFGTKCLWLCCPRWFQTHIFSGVNKISHCNIEGFESNGLRSDRACLLEVWCRSGPGSVSMVLPGGHGYGPRATTTPYRALSLNCTCRCSHEWNIRRGPKMIPGGGIPSICWLWLCLGGRNREVCESPRLALPPVSGVGGHSAVLSIVCSIHHLVCH